MNKLLLLALFSVAFSQPGEGVSGYLRELEVSFCMDECSQFYLESENGSYISNIAFNNINTNFL